jgi:hypothetical protein
MSSPTPPPESPWASPDGPVTVGAAPSGALQPISVQPISTRVGAAIAGRPQSGSRQSGLVAGPMRVFDAGAVTGVPLTSPPPPAPLVVPVKDAATARRQMLRWFGGTAGGIIAVGIVVLLALTLTGHNPFPARASAGPDTRPILAKLCPPPSAAPAPDGSVPATPPGPRVVDRASGISYRAYGAPWETWDQSWETGGQLGIAFRTGQFFVTELYPGGGEYLASILSGSVPAATNDALTLDLQCAGHQVAADVRQAYYPQPNTMQTLVDKADTLGGRPAWLSEFELHFHVTGLKANSELVAIATIDIGKPNASILYISIPGTHKQYDYVIDQLLASVRPI